MTDEPQEHPFKPGARVAAISGWDHDIYTEHHVDKLYKSGRFTLTGDTQQWRADRWASDKQWRAYATGSVRYHREHIIIWDETTDAAIREAQAKKAREQRFYALRKRFEKLHQSAVTDAMLDAVEAVLPPEVPR